MAGNTEFFAQEIVKQKIEDLWSKVFESSNKVLKEHKVYGFTGIAVIPDPNVHERLVALQVFSAVIDVLLNASKAGMELEYEQTRQLLNAKSQITNMERVAAALTAENREDYDVAVEALDKQLVI